MMHRFRHTLSIARAAFAEQARAERAYLGNFWFGMLSKFIYNTMFLLFIDQLYARVGHFAGYSKNDFLFLYFVSQLGFYTCYYGIFFSMQRVVQTVRNGNFDLLLLKPVPHRTMLYIMAQTPYELILTAVPSLLIILFLVQWSALSFSFVSVLMGLVVWLCGIVICNTITFALTLPVFKTGDATDTLNTFYNFTSMSQMPYTRLPTVIKVAALGIFPQIIIAGASTEVMLQKTDGVGLMCLLIATAIVSIIMVNLMWRWALRNYTSVTS